jgi:hypothetical protein
MSRHSPSALFGVLRDFLAKHGADEIQWDAIDRLQEQHEASRVSSCCNSPLVNEGGAVRCMNCTAEDTPNSLIRSEPAAISELPPRRA